MGKPDLHIVCFAVPYPAHYGGAIDVYNRLKALHKEGLAISLHCFLYGDFKPHAALKELAQEVNYYPRISWPALLAPGMPYIISSRRNPLLLRCLKKDDSPILFEGIHSTAFIQDLPGRKKLLRAHNIEHHYYAQLAKESQRVRYLFFQRESIALESYESQHAKQFDRVFTISPGDQEWYQHKSAASTFIPVFHGFEKCNSVEGRGEYILYQGDLSIETNQKAVNEFLDQLSDKYPIVIAGKSGDRSFEEKLTKRTNLRREADVSEMKMNELIRDAQIVIVHSRHSSGMKVKLFPALYQGRHVLANENSLTHTDLDNALYVYSSMSELPQRVEHLWNMDFTASDQQLRKEALSCLPDDQTKAKEIIRYLS